MNIVKRGGGLFDDEVDEVAMRIGINDAHGKPPPPNPFWIRV